MHPSAAAARLREEGVASLVVEQNAEIALSVLAELSLERYGGSGKPLRLSDELFERTISRRRE